MGVRKATISMDVYYPEEDEARFMAADLNTVLFETGEGGWIASSPIKSAGVSVLDEQLRAELRAIGEDGSFFDETDIDNLVSPKGPSPR
jgi:hypothetical protein